MPTTLNKEAYCELIKEDLEWLEKQPRSLEHDHIRQILKWSIGVLYPEPEQNPRFIVIDDSVSAHCCFEATVIDTSQGKYDWDVWKGQMCESFSLEDADLIAKALNQMFSSQK